ncbi:hypothetical protein JCM1393_15900 [Clostridium carnis]
MIKNLTKKKKKKGFTLIELIIVIAIIAILAAIAIPKFGAVRDSANKKADIANAKTIANAAATLLAEDGNAKVAGEVKDGTVVAAYIQSVPTPKTLEGSFYVDNNSGTIKVYIAAKGLTSNIPTTNEAYPDQKGTVAK